MISKKEAS